jgi:hypothetical protein
MPPEKRKRNNNNNNNNNTANNMTYKLETCSETFKLMKALNAKKEKNNKKKIETKKGYMKLSILCVGGGEKGRLTFKALLKDHLCT